MTEDVSVTPAPVVEATPVVAPVESAPVVVETTNATAPVVTETDSTNTSAVAKELPVEKPADAPKPLLGPEAEAAKQSDAVVAEAPKTESEPAPLPVYEFKLPEGAQADN